MKRILVVFLLCIPLFLGGCAGDDRPVLSVYNWGDYIDPDLIAQFEDEFDCRVNYETFTSNEDLYVKLKNSTDTYDVLVPSDYMIERLINEDMLRPINKDNVPNLSIIEPQALNLPFDPENTYSVPYFYGVLGILYNPEMVSDPVDSWDILWNDKYASKILMYDSIRDSMGASLSRLGFSMNETSEANINAARDALIKQKPLVMAYVTDNVKNLMATDGAAMALVYSGDAAIVMDENNKLAFAVPKEGSNVYYDNFVIPNNSKNPELAESFINYMLTPEIAARNMEYVGFSAPNPQAISLMDDNWKNNTAFNIQVDDLARSEIFVDLPNNILELYNKAWTEVNVSK
ncbi:ABC transporter substrate-binding protein [Acetobacterium bakii]|uniref:Spermidine/putrescine ABC transporter substrate-binding protein n=1 Tax=Acetobacterium bakii TaxID=52689 RepID=A0A0L6U374_9FIRM|nr:spermidine/putrescine ABC transporter substrate-binding protein [Acetobacterium bakii]KNZ42964.1 spermidine/putrescine ABC transporter substrate-binding protein [Acetobacterium bakii]